MSAAFHDFVEKVRRFQSRIDTVPEYLAPGVFVEEVSNRSKAIEGVSTTGVGAFLLGILLRVLAALAVDRARRRRHLRPDWAVTG